MKEEINSYSFQTMPLIQKSKKKINGLGEVIEETNVCVQCIDIEKCKKIFDEVWKDG
jgi:hypothetical protein